MKTISQALCKICHRPMQLTWDSDSPQEAVDKWFPMACHNACADRIRKRNDSFDVITKICFRLSCLPKDTEAARRTRAALAEKLRDPLERALGAYAEAMREILGAPEVVYYRAKLDRLLENPEAAVDILRQYRAEIREAAAAATQNQNEPDQHTD